ncbi:MAG: citrate synthase [Clostridia bacterium]|nr:citrate synthase [Clostridia bacterium]MBR2328055.1 citrate synthase [Clostridia bacterium]
MTTTKQYQTFINEVVNRYEKYNNLDNSYYNKIAVKRGLRNSDGTGVIAGLTKICNVHGYIIDEGEKKPCKGELIYRGININDIVSGITADDRYGFEETAYLLLFGKLPNAQQLDRFKTILFDASRLPDGYVESVIKGIKTSNYMNKLASSVLALYSYDKRADDCSLENSIRQSVELIARFPIIIALNYLNEQGRLSEVDIPALSSKSKSIAEAFLSLIRGKEGYTDEEAKLLDLCLVLHAEHGGGNNSTFTTRVLTSSGTDIYAAISGAVNSLKGPKHGGANIKVVEMMDVIKSSVSNWSDDEEIIAFLERIIRKEVCDRSGLIYGMGHAVYTLSDPRSLLLKQYAEKLAKKDAALYNEFNLIKKVEELTPYIYSRYKKSEKQISSNVDMYSGFVYKMLGIPTELFTPLFALSRITGWSAHRLEELTSCKKIIRPAYKSIATPIRYTPLKTRK